MKEKQQVVLRSASCALQGYFQLQFELVFVLRSVVSLNLLPSQKITQFRRQNSEEKTAALCKTTAPYTSLGFLLISCLREQCGKGLAL